MEEIFKPKILAFLCNWCAYAGADLAGVSRFQYPPSIRVIRTMCSGRVDPIYVVQGLQNGFDSVFVSGWHIGECHYLDGNVHLAKHIEVVEKLLDLSGIGRDRVTVKWVSAAEGRLFAEYVKEITENIRHMGPFDPRKFELSLAAVEIALNSPRLRWLMGVGPKITERENVYREKTDEDEYRSLLKRVTEDEYEKALILKVLKEGTHSVREIAVKTGLPVYDVSVRLGELERCRQAKFHSCEGNVNIFSAADTETT